MWQAYDLHVPSALSIHCTANPGPSKHMLSLLWSTLLPVLAPAELALNCKCAGCKMLGCIDILSKLQLAMALLLVCTVGVYCMDSCRGAVVTSFLAVASGVQSETADNAS